VFLASKWPQTQKFRTFNTIKQLYAISLVHIYWSFTIVWVKKKVLNAHSTFVGPSVILLQPYVKCVEINKEEENLTQQEAMFGHQVVVCQGASILIEVHYNDEHAAFGGRYPPPPLSFPPRIFSCELKSVQMKDTPPPPHSLSQ